MPDFSHKASYQYWKDYNDPIIHQVIVKLESMESWTIDGDPELEKAIEKLGKTMDNIGDIDLKLEKQFIELLTYIKAGRMLRIMQCIDTAHPGAASKLLTYAEENNSKNDNCLNLFLQRNIAFERLRLLSRILSPERLNLIQKALESD